MHIIENTEKVENWAVQNILHRNCPVNYSVGETQIGSIILIQQVAAKALCAALTNTARANHEAYFYGTTSMG